MTGKQKARTVQLIGAVCMVVGVATYRTSDTYAAWLMLGLALVIGAKAWEWLQKD